MFGIERIFSQPVAYLVTFLALVVSIGVHEFAHVFAAYLQGDNTGKALGRLTLNPIRHLDPIGTVAIALIGIGWGRPAPFNPYNLRFHRWGPALVAIAGPISNLLMVLLAGFGFALLYPSLGAGNLLSLFLAALTFLNAALAVFNLIPVHPLDGSHLLRALLGPNNALVVTLERYGFYILLGILLLAGNLLSAYLYGGINVIFSVFGLHGVLNDIVRVMTGG